MATPRPPKVVLSERERAELERLVRAFTTGQQLALRARIVLAAGDGLNNLQIARELGVDDETPGHWRESFVINAQFPSNLQVVQAVACRQHNPRSQGELLARCKCAHQALQLRAFPLTQHYFRRSRRGHHPFRSNQDASSYPALEPVPAPFRLPVLDSCFAMNVH